MSTENNWDQPATPSAPPYIGFLAFLNTLEWLERENVPLRFDRSFMGDRFNGSKGAQLMAALRFLSLINGSRTKPDLEKLVVAKGDDRKTVLLDILRNSYPSVQFDQLSRTTPSMLSQCFDIYGIDGHTKRKAEAFFINAIKFTGHPLSPSLSRRTRVRRSSTTENAGTSIKTSKRTIQKDAPPDVSQSVSNTRVVDLKSGGSVRISVDVDLFELSPTDREFVLSLIDQVRNYSSSSDASIFDNGGEHGREKAERPAL